VPYIDPKALHESEQDTEAYNDVPLEPKGGTALIGPGDHMAVLIMGQEKEEEKVNPETGEKVKHKYELLKLGMTVRTEEGDLIKGHFWSRVYEHHHDRYTNLWATLVGPDAPAGNYRSGQFQGHRFMVRLGYSKDQTSGRLWVQRFWRIPPQQDRGTRESGEQQRAQGRNGNDSQAGRQGYSGQREQARPSQGGGYGQTYGGQRERAQGGPPPRGQQSHGGQRREAPTRSTRPEPEFVEAEDEHLDSPLPF
jgi:hypothetical protein